MLKKETNKESENVKKKSIEERLKAHPFLKERIESLINIVENSDGNIEKANEAEQRVIKELRQMGNEVLHDWAENQNGKKGKEIKEKNNDINKHRKKNSIGIQHLEK